MPIKKSAHPSDIISAELTLFELSRVWQRPITTARLQMKAVTPRIHKKYLWIGEDIKSSQSDISSGGGRHRSKGTLKGSLETRQQNLNESLYKLCKFSSPANVSCLKSLISFPRRSSVVTELRLEKAPLSMLIRLLCLNSRLWRLVSPLNVLALKISTLP